MYKENIGTSITPETKVGELLESYPFLEAVLIDLAPVFTKLKNPVLRKTIARVTSLRQAATVGQLPVSKLINELRRAAGMDSEADFEADSWKLNAPEKQEEEIRPSVIYDARQDLEDGVHPGAKVATGVSKLNSGEVYLLITPFTPAPLIDKMKDKGHTVWSRKAGKNKFETYIKKS
ncbi:MAG: DUF1858 domain-containing protein [Ignavibacteria bacterium]|jgi:hypothetical protein|nr:DUF1858 domain-containing protein [Ignavibacteria bacterium]MCU7504852.1 DUF1858 domain-containing protein [Ignavibacteria bacterium]MCU7518336.1 DUF1858 domain-containing protein [Ignavibacteria bacterium]